MLRNEILVIPYCEGVPTKGITLGKLKDLFLKKEIKNVEKIYVPSKNKYFLGRYKATKGFTFKELKGETK